MIRALIFLILFLWTTNDSWAQPGSYTFCFGFILYDNGAIVADTSKYLFSWQDNISTKSPFCDNYKQAESYLISYRLPSYRKQYSLNIVNSQADTMKLTFLHQSGMDRFFFVKKLPFQKGHYILSQGMFDYPSRLPDNFDFLKEKRDSAGNLIVEDFWNWDKKVLKEKLLYDKNGNEIKSEYWWDNGNKRRETDRMRNTTITWHPNGQLDVYSTDSSYINMDKEGKIIKRVKLNSQTEQWENY
jgi:hypothetical protein